jgi:Sec23/Sec24 zinc finger
VTPLQRLENCPALPYEPVVCRSCPCVLNPYCGADFNSRVWRCPLWCVVDVPLQLLPSNSGCLEDRLSLTGLVQGLPHHAGSMTVFPDGHHGMLFHV